MSLRFLRKVARFPANNNSYFDEYASSALRAVSSEQAQSYIREIEMAWHRPSGDPALLKDSLLKYDVKPSKRCLSGDYLAILKKTMDELRPKERLIPLTLGAAYKHRDFPRTTSPGFPWIHQGYNSKGEVLDDPKAVGHIHRTWDQIGRGIPWSLPDSLAYHRVVASPREKTKVRPVWGYPVECVAEEARYFLPLIEHLKGKCNQDDAFYGLGLETALSGHSHLAAAFHACGAKLAMNTDLSNFDARVPAWEIRDVFAFLADWFDFSKVRDSEGLVWNCNPQQTARRWKAMVSYFINTKIRTPSGDRVQKKNGVPSGSMWTNAIDTFVNAVQSRTACYRVTGSLPVKDYYYGDDGTIFLAVDKIDLDAYAQELLTTFNAILSVEKTILTDNVENIHWLGYFYRPDGPRRSLDFVIASTLYPERRVSSPVESAARLLGQLYSVMDPHASVLFYDAVSWLMRKYEFSQQTLEEYISTLPSKAFKYLTTLGLTTTDIRLPDCFRDPFRDRYIPAVLPRACSRRLTPFRDLRLPEYAFVPEAYTQRVLRKLSFSNFSEYLSTFEFYDEAHLDEAYFTD
jgi:hypothetical protein